MEMVETEQGAGEGEEGVVDVAATFVADAQAAVAVKLGEGAFDNPAMAA